MSSWWSSAFAPGVIAATVTLTANWWLTRPRANLRMVVTHQSAEDIERLARGNDGSASLTNPRSPLMPSFCVRLTNYGDGAAYDVKLTSDECQPRVWVGDSGEWIGDEDRGGPRAAVRWPLWSDTLAALTPGESVNVLLMVNTEVKPRMVNPEQKPPVVKASWPRLPGRRAKWLRWLRLGPASAECDLATARTIEAKWPGTYDTR